MDCNVNYNKLFNRFREVLSKEITKHTVTVNKHTNFAYKFSLPNAPTSTWFDQFLSTLCRPNVFKRIQKKTTVPKRKIV